MTRIEDFAEGVAGILVNDGGVLKLQQLVDDGQVAVDVSLGIARAHD